MTVRPVSAGSVIEAPPSAEPPGAGIEVGSEASRLWSPTIQNVDPGRTFSTSDISCVLLLSGASLRVRLEIAASTWSFEPKTSVDSSRKATATVCDASFAKL